jgi:glycosyltransferase involved in cell wall biosynthesis
VNKVILYITYDGLTDPLGQSQILPYLLGLVSYGYSFHVLSFEKEDRGKENQSLIEKQIEGTPIVWHPQKYHKRPPVLSTVYDLWQMKREAKVLHRQFGFTGIWCRSYLPAMAGRSLKKKHRIPFIFDMRGFWADERVDGGSWPQTNPLFRTIYKYFKQQERLLLREADHIVVLTNNAKDILSRKQLQNNPIPKAISVVPCCVDHHLFSPDGIAPKQKQLARNELGIAIEDRVLVYAGSLGTWYMLREMLLYFHSLKIQDSKWRFLFLTKDNAGKVFEEAILAGIDRNDIFVRFCSRSEMPLYLSIAQMAISFILPVFSKHASSPTKLAEYMSMGLPSVCNQGIGDVDKIIVEAGAGELVDQNGKSVVLGNADSMSIRKYAELQFSLEKGVLIYENILNHTILQT